MRSGRYFEVATITKHLSVMLSAGIPINEALQSVLGQKISPSLRKVFTDILDSVTNGSSLSDALRKHKEIFSDYYISLVQIGEESGTLEDNLKYLSNQLQKDILTRRKFTSAILYPTFVLSFAFIIAAGISIFILPRLIDFFQGFDIPLPVATRVLLSIAGYMKNFGVVTFAGIAGVIILITLLVRLKPVKKIWDGVSIRLPFAGNIIATYQITRMCRNFGTLLKSGVSIARSIEVTSDSLSNSVIAGNLKKVSADIEQGRTLTSSLAKHSIFPTLIVKMVEVGEKSGKLDESFIYLADFYDGELDDLTKNFETVLEPILLVIVGIIVAFIALAIITPIYQLTGSIGTTTP